MPKSTKNKVSQQDFLQLEGVWRSRGYGYILLINPQGYTLYEETAVSCRPTYGGSLQDLAERYRELHVSPGGKSFSVRRATGVSRLSYQRLQALPSTVSEQESDVVHDPELNFEVFWNCLNEHYVLFDLKAVDWAAAYEQYRPQVQADTLPDALFNIMASMLRPLRDGHVRLQTPVGNFEAGALPALYKRLGLELEAAEDSRDVLSYLAELREWLREVIREDYLLGSSQQAGNRLLEWGRLDKQTGFLAVRAMAGQSGKIGAPATDLEIIDTVMAKVLGDLADSTRIVIDLRGNGGGYDGVALRLASYFIDRKRLAFTKAARAGERLTGEQRVYVSANPAGVYKGEVIVLTSELTASAAEIFVLALLQRPGLTLIGEPTQGILSDTLERHLPNGWYLTLSNEVYRSFDGEHYEDSGIPPHIRIPFLGRKGREAGHDPMLDRVLRM